jgi:hypothetical protein
LPVLCCTSPLVFAIVTSSLETPAGESRAAVVVGSASPMDQILPVTQAGKKPLYCRHSPSERTTLGVDRQNGSNTCLGCKLPYAPGSPNSRMEPQDSRLLASPIGQATTAKEQGQGFFEIQLKVGSSQRDSTVFGGNNDNIERTRTQSHAGTLAAIESIGWRLEHVGYVFVVTSESSRDKMLRTGQQTAVSGDTIGIYLFRNVD